MRSLTVPFIVRETGRRATSWMVRCDKKLNASSWVAAALQNADGVLLTCKTKRKRYTSGIRLVVEEAGGRGAVQPYYLFKIPVP